jgi:hypothetical protein
MMPKVRTAATRALFAMKQIARKNNYKYKMKMINYNGRHNFSSSLANTSLSGGMNQTTSTLMMLAAVGGVAGATFLTDSYNSNINSVVFAETDKGNIENHNTASKEEGEEVDNNEAPVVPEDRPRTSVSVYLSNEAKQKLKEQFPSIFKNERYDHLTIYFNPSDAELKPVYKLLGNGFSIQPLAYVSNESSQILYCKIIKKEDGSRNIQSSNKYPHVTLSFSDMSNAAASNLLLQRIDARGILQVAAGSSTFKWNGVLPVWKDEKGKLHSTTRVNVASIKGRMNILLDGTLCTNRHWKKLDTAGKEADEGNIETKDYSNEEDIYYCDKPTCGFCEFMKGGPCREVFINWEDCVDKCNDVSGDFVDECSAETIQLKECIDNNQEYYGVLNQAPPEEEEEANNE